MPEDFSKISEGESVARFWRGYGKRNFPELSVVARAVLGAPASSSILERDFGEAGKLVNRQRGSMSTAYVDMVMFLKGSYDLIPLDVKAIPAKDVESAIPLRLRDAQKRAEVHEMDCGVEDEAPLDESGVGESSLFTIDD